MSAFNEDFRPRMLVARRPLSTEFGRELYAAAKFGVDAVLMPPVRAGRGRVSARLGVEVDIRSRLRRFALLMIGGFVLVLFIASFMRPASGLP